MIKNIILFIILFLSFYISNSSATAINEIAPDFNAQMLNGEKVNLYDDIIGYDYNNRPIVILSFFNTACVPCEKEIKELSKIRKEYSDDFVKIYLVSLDNNKESVNKHLTEKLKVTNIPVIFDKEGLRVGQVYGVVDELTGFTKVPELFIIDKNIKIRNKFTGAELSGNIKKKMSDILDIYIKESVNKINPPDNLITIIYTNSLNANIQSCDCDISPFGGLDRRMTVFNKERQFNPNILLLDTGDNLPVTKNKLKSDLILKVLADMKYSAVIPGDQEFIFDADYLAEKIVDLKLPIVLSNLTYCDSAACYEFGKQSKIIEIGKYKIGILGYIDESAFFFAETDIKTKLQIESIDKIEISAKELKTECDLVILLSHSGFSNDKLIAEKINDIDIIIGGHSQTLLSEPCKINNTYILQAGKDGYNVGRFDVFMNSDKKIEKTKNKMRLLTDSIKPDSKILKMIEYYEKAIK
ncbi:redoxin domain-containing protein [Candidatus Dependentiae bacterium]|nr:redoxin domain-containing protein [Candidatus Dependentiae bacterium]